MIRRRLNLLSFVLKSAVCLIPAVAFGIAAEVRFFSGMFGPAAPDIRPWIYWDLLLVTTIVWVGAAGYCGLWKLEYLFTIGSRVREWYMAPVITCFAMMGYGFFYRGGSYSRIFVALSGALLWALTGMTFIIFRYVVNSGGGRWNTTRILIVGADRFARRAARQLTLPGTLPCSVVGYVRLPGQETMADGGRLYELDELAHLADGNEVDEVIIAVPPERLSEIGRLAKAVESLCTPIRAIVDTGERTFAPEKLFDFGGMVMLDLQSTPAETVKYLVLKRGFDIILSLFVLIVTLPVMVLIAFGIKLTSPGPVLFVQERVGLNGRVFQMYKFRTMWVGNVEESATRWTVRDDPRRTGFGALLRQYNLDEFPQFFNVLKGEMSIVGPRPERPHFVRAFLQDVTKYNSRHHLKAGITGWAQVNGLRGDTSIARRVECDLYYLRNWTFLLDLRIIALTLLRGLRSKNAY